MAYTVWGAFDWFREKVVDLESEQVTKARTSRDYLFNQIKLLSDQDIYFPRLYGNFLPFGSFARSSKKRPLNDIDILVSLNGRSTQDTSSTSDQYTSWLKIMSNDAPLSSFLDNYGYVSSTKVLNKFRDSLALIPNYKRAEIHKRMQAVTLALTSYTWVFDIVPAVPISNGSNGISHYLIPNGSGDWIRTDPRIDSVNITRVNQKHDGEFLPSLRLLKYWNARTHKPVLGSYYFETLAMSVFNNAQKIQNFPQAMKYFFENCHTYLYSSCNDPKNLGPNLDVNVEWDTKQKISNAMNEAAEWVGYALMYEENSQEKDAIYWWGRIFGSNFPNYG
jgi:hypothetical protein